ncbi:MAG: hypothetical protein GTO14_07255 [Anaerolineales bacterium]|nr:hypothetical protein [Anaerolineales bacterium]
MTFPGNGTPFAANPVIVAALIGVVAIILFVVIFTAYLLYHRDTNEAGDMPDKPELVD